MKVLIADDDRALVHMLAAAFRKRGWEVVQAFDAMQAVMYSNRSPRPDVVVLDLGMPGGTGFGVLQKLGRSSQTSGIPVVVLTGSDDDEDVDRALEMGATELLRKPVEPETLVDEVEAVVGGSPD